uniref:uncharacterized protein n=1 Tax=Lonchura striata TaxID=40157 RepID=UPI0012939F58|nr:uncharacterized protein LOC110480054 [Lonchura striata domestica]
MRQEKVKAVGSGAGVLEKLENGKKVPELGLPSNFCDILRKGRATNSAARDVLCAAAAGAGRGAQEERGEQLGGSQGALLALQQQQPAGRLGTEGLVPAVPPSQPQEAAPCPGHSPGQAEPAGSRDELTASDCSIERGHRATEISPSFSLGAEGSFSLHLAHPNFQSTPGLFLKKAGKAEGRAGVVEIPPDLQASPSHSNEEAPGESPAPGCPGEQQPPQSAVDKTCACLESLELESPCPGRMQSLPSLGFLEKVGARLESLELESPCPGRMQSLPSLGFLEKVGAWDVGQPQQGPDATSSRVPGAVPPAREASSARPRASSCVLPVQKGPGDAEGRAAPACGGTGSLGSLRFPLPEALPAPALSRSRSDNAVSSSSRALAGASPGQLWGALGGSGSSTTREVAPGSPAEGVRSAARRSSAPAVFVSSAAQLLRKDGSSPAEEHQECEEKGSESLSLSMPSGDDIMDIFGAISLESLSFPDGPGEPQEALVVPGPCPSAGGSSPIPPGAALETPKKEELNIEERIPVYLRNLGIQQSPGTILAPFVPRGSLCELEFSPWQPRSLQPALGTLSEAPPRAQGALLPAFEMCQASRGSDVSPLSVSLAAGSEAGWGQERELPSPREPCPSSPRLPGERPPGQGTPLGSVTAGLGGSQGSLCQPGRAAGTRGSEDSSSGDSLSARVRSLLGRPGHSQELGSAPGLFQSSVPGAGSAPGLFQSSVPGAGSAPGPFQSSVPGAGSAPGPFQSSLPGAGSAPGLFQSSVPGAGSARSRAGSSSSSGDSLAARVRSLLGTTSPGIPASRLLRSAEEHESKIRAWVKLKLASQSQERGPDWDEETLPRMEGVEAELLPKARKPGQAKDPWLCGLEAASEYLRKQERVQASSCPRDRGGHLSRTHGQLSSTHGQLSSTHGQLSSTRGQLSSTEGQLSSTQGQLSSTHGQLSSTHGQLSSSHGHLSRTQGQLSSTQGQLSSTEGQLSSSHGQLSSSHGQLSRTGELFQPSSPPAAPLPTADPWDWSLLQDVQLKPWGAADLQDIHLKPCSTADLQDAQLKPCSTADLQLKPCSTADLQDAQLKPCSTADLQLKLCSAAELQDVQLQPPAVGHPSSMAELRAPLARDDGAGGSAAAPCAHGELSLADEALSTVPEAPSWPVRRFLSCVHITLSSRAGSGGNGIQPWDKPHGRARAVTSKAAPEASVEAAPASPPAEGAPEAPSSAEPVAPAGPSRAFSPRQELLQGSARARLRDWGARGTPSSAPAAKAGTRTSDAATQITTEGATRATLSAEICVDAQDGGGPAQLPSLPSAPEAPGIAAPSRREIPPFPRQPAQPLLLPYKPSGSSGMYYVPFQKPGATVSPGEPEASTASSHSGSEEAPAGLLAPVLGVADDLPAARAVAQHGRMIHAHRPKLAWPEEHSTPLEQPPELPDGSRRGVRVPAGQSCQDPREPSRHGAGAGRAAPSSGAAPWCRWGPRAPRGTAGPFFTLAAEPDDSRSEKPGARASFGNGAAGTELPHGAAGTELPHGAAGTELPHRAAGTELPHGAAGTEHSHGAAGTELPHGAAGTEYSHGAAGREYSHGAAGTELPHGAAGTELPHGAASSDPGPRGRPARPDESVGKAPRPRGRARGGLDELWLRFLERQGRQQQQQQLGGVGELSLVQRLDRLASSGAEGCRGGEPGKGAARSGAGRDSRARARRGAQGNAGRTQATREPGQRRPGNAQ